MGERKKDIYCVCVIKSVRGRKSVCECVRKREKIVCVSVKLDFMALSHFT